MAARTRLLAVLLAALTLVGGCAFGRDDTAAGAAARGGTGQGTAEAVRSAARATAEAGGATVTVTSRGPARDRAVTTTGTGSVDLRGRAASLALRVSDLGRVDALTVGRTAYGALPPGAIDGIARGRTWVSVDLDRVDLGLYADTTVQLATGITGNPADLATVLEALTDDVRVVGPETVDGVPTIHFRGGVDLAGLAVAAPDLQGATDRLRAELSLAAVPVDVWVDASGRLRRVTETLVPGETFTTTTLSAPGPQPAVVAPPAERVRDLVRELRLRAS